MIAPLERVYPVNPELDDIAGIIVLGGGERGGLSAASGQVQVNGAGERLMAGASLARRFPHARLIFTGRGSHMGAEWVCSISAPAGEDTLADAGRCLLEPRSRNTPENARYSLSAVQPGMGERYVLVTSAFHMPRAMASFERAGWQGLIPYPVDHRSGDARLFNWDLAAHLDLMNLATKEYAGAAAYGLLGR